MSRLQELKDLVASFEKDFVKFYEKGNKSAGTRVRKEHERAEKEGPGNPEGSPGNKGAGQRGRRNDTRRLKLGLQSGSTGRHIPVGRGGMASCECVSLSLTLTEPAPPVWLKEPPAESRL